MNLAIDIGNTRVKVGVFLEGELSAQGIWPDFSLERVETLAYNHPIKNVILSTVGPLEAEVTPWMEERFFFLQLTHHTQIPILNRYKTPETLGKDRLAAVIGAQVEFPGQNCLVIDAGTCITYDLLTADKTYHGGTIAPGIQMRLEAMHKMTAKLPLVERSPLGPIIGTSTTTALQNGAQWGALLEAKAFIDQCEEQYGSLQVIFTGGDASFFEKYLKRKIFVNQHLVLTGLNKILTYNAST